MQTDEQIVKLQICDWLAAQPSCMFQVRNNARMSRRHRYSKNGLPDIDGIWKGKPLYIEVKAPGGKVYEDQIRFINEAKRMGAIAFIAYSLEDVIKELSS